MFYKTSYSVTTVMFCLIQLIHCSTTQADFLESWESSSIGSYTPSATIGGDMGTWYIEDTVSEFPECGPTPQRGDIISNNNNKMLKLISNDSGSECADNIYAVLAPVSAPITPNTVISFEEMGELINPQSGWPTCSMPPCGDTVNLWLEDNHGNALAYVFQRPGSLSPNERFTMYRDIFLDVNAGVHERNLFDDFSTIPDFNPQNATVTFINFEVFSHGWATIDNIHIREITPPSKAINPSPGNGSTNQLPTVDLSWSNGGGATSYDVYFGTDTTPDSSEFKVNQTGISYDPGTLSYNTTYYWRIDAKNSSGTTTGDVWSFTTGPLPLPLKAVNPSPSNGASNQSIDVNVSWSNGGGATSYDVYFGTDNPPTNIVNGTNQSETTYDPGALLYGTTYYWQIDSVNTSGTTTGDIWSFTTEPVPPISDHVFLVEMSKEWDYETPGESLHYDFDVVLFTDGTVQSASFTTPAGEPPYLLPWNSNDQGWSYHAEYSTPDDLDVYGPGDYLFTIEYIGGSTDTTAIPYEVPGGGEITQVVQEPVMTYPTHGQIEVPANLTLQWEQYIGTVANGIGIDVEPQGGPGLEVQVSLDDLSLSSYGPINLTPGRPYKIQFTFDHAYHGFNEDGIEYVVDADSESKIFFTTFKYSGGDGSAATPFEIANAGDLLELRDYSEDWGLNYVMTNNIDLEGQGDNPDGRFSTAVIAPDTSTSTGYQGTPFSGVFDGNDHTISNLTIDTAGAGNDFLGLFGKIAGSSAEVKNLGVENINITGGDDSWYLGGLCGRDDEGTITNCYATGSITGYVYLGGLCGWNVNGTITNCYATDTITGGDSSWYLGGLCGRDYEGTITNCYATGSVSGGNDSKYYGGLCGYNHLNLSLIHI